MENNILLIYAKQYYNLGINVTCITNYLTEINFNEKNITKSPCHPWTHYQNERQKLDELISLDWKNAIGIGAVLGYNDLRAIDIDGCSNIKIVNEILEILGLPYDYEWIIQSGSHNGFHIIVKSGVELRYTNVSTVGAYLATSKNFHLFEKMEFRWNNHIVLPPSIHKSSFEYIFLNNKFPSSFPTEIDSSLLGSIVDKYLKETKYCLRSDGYGFYFTTEPTIPDSKYLSAREIKNRHPNFNYIVIDIKTDEILSWDTEKSTNQIIQIAWLILGETGRILKKEAELISINDSDSQNKYTNIDWENASKVSVDLRTALDKLQNDIRECNYIVGHNIDFDLNSIRTALKRFGLHDYTIDKHIICTMKSSLNYCKIPNKNGLGYKYPTLNELYEKLFNDKFIESHNAIGDVLATAKCLIKLQNEKII
jgi:DNA polymerase III epsilon subunit-like protein